MFFKCHRFVISFFVGSGGGASRAAGRGQHCVGGARAGVRGWGVGGGL